MPEDLRADPFVQRALTIEATADLAPELEEWARKEFGISREAAAKAVDKFMTQTKFDKYMQAYRKDVLASDPGLLQAWDEEYEKGNIDYTPSSSKWVKEFMADYYKEQNVP